AIGLGDLLPFGIPEQLIDIMLGRLAAEARADLVIDMLLSMVVFVIHIEIDAELSAAHAKIRPPLQLYIAACDRHGSIAPVFILEGHGAILGIDLLHRYVEHAARNR